MKAFSLNNLTVWRIVKRTKIGILFSCKFILI